MGKYKDCLVKVGVRPTYLKDFAAFVQLMTVMRDEEKNMYKQTTQVRTM